MAGDWIKWGIGLTDKREILEMSSRLMIPPAHAAGILMRAMEWVDANVTEFDGNGHANVPIKSCPPNILDSIVGVSGFSEAMAEVGWMTHKDGVLTFIHAGRHNGKSAKARALNTDNKRINRSLTNVTIKKGQCPDASSLSLNSVGGDARGTQPTREQWLQEAREKRPDWPRTDAEGAWHHYEANGWRIGRNPVKKWQACILTCYRNWQAQGSGGVSSTPRPPARKVHIFTAEEIAEDERNAAQFGR